MSFFPSQAHRIRYYSLFFIVHVNIDTVVRCHGTLYKIHRVISVEENEKMFETLKHSVERNGKSKIWTWKVVEVCERLMRKCKWCCSLLCVITCSNIVSQLFQKLIEFIKLTYLHAIHRCTVHTIHTPHATHWEWPKEKKKVKNKWRKKIISTYSPSRKNVRIILIHYLNAIYSCGSITQRILFMIFYKISISTFFHSNIFPDTCVRYFHHSICAIRLMDIKREE